ncbi:MAG: type II secretion system protein GspG [bacterium]|nr:type II secretion system protein GspG [bacterium]
MLANTRKRSSPKRNFEIKKHVQLSGFTVVEMLVVLLVISILALAIVMVVNGKITDAKYSQAIADLDALRSAITLYQIDLGNFPPSTCSADSIYRYGNAVLLKALTVSMSGNAATASPLWRGPYLDIKKMRLSADEKLILDPWENPYSYIVYTDYSTAQDWMSSTSSNTYFGTFNSNGIDTYENPLTYQLFSMGKNGFTKETTAGPVANTSCGGKDSDDINNWYGDERNH